jgi:hypothetical protein
MSETAVVVAETADEVEAHLWAGALRDAGLRSEVLMRGPAGALGGVVAFPASSFQVLVQRGALETARNVIAELGGARRLMPVAPASAGNPMRIAWLMGGAIVAFLGLGLLLRLLEG